MKTITTTVNDNPMVMGTAMKMHGHSTVEMLDIIYIFVSMC